VVIPFNPLLFIVHFPHFCTQCRLFLEVHTQTHKVEALNETVTHFPRFLQTMTARTNGGVSGASSSALAAEEAVDAQNLDYHDRLKGKAAYLKSLAFDIESEAKDHHRLLGGMDDDMDSAGGLLSASLGRVRHMMNSGRGNRRLMCYVTAGVVGGLIVLYLMMNKLMTRSSPA